ncbi:Growth/differentiation factor 9 [Channa argus]|uniref:Growth/differentiation factor 9 n=1 Tax=Channa argus TaxID=215402 RepID=A0A6G1PUE0_CHAAH|nr:Growth/differentiation factor 9 [Channa argus]
MLMAAALRYFRTVALLLLVTCSCPLVRSSLAASNALHKWGDFSYPYSSIFSPLLKALSEHGGSRWNPSLKKKTKPEHRYIKYLKEVYRKSSRVQRSLDGNSVYNTVRLIKPEDECLAQSNKESFMQDLSYSLEQVRRKEQLLKSALLYNFDHNHPAPGNLCYLSIKEQELSNQCQLCPGVRHAVNFTADAESRSNRYWVEVDITSFLHPLFKFQKKNIHLLINITCPEEQRARALGRRGLLEFTLRSPPLLLYLNDTGKSTNWRLLVSAGAGQRPSAAASTFHKKRMFKPGKRFGRKRRWKRESQKSKRGDKGLDIHLPELLPISEFPTSDCALYDFRVRFSQLKLDHWIVFPPKYNPRYCRGICPRTMGFIYGSPVHTMVQNIIYEKLDSSVPRPSCVPSHYSPLSVMIFEEDGSYVYKEFEDMIATRCTCR